ncbi:MAG: Gfo/Idh/MocA family oxidoreductase [Bacteroidota bacterium]
MNILLIGFGSIGRRHYNNLIKLNHQNISLVRRNATPVDNCPVYGSIKEACSNHTFSHAVIATPTALHSESFFELLSYGVPNIYLEKPVCESLEKAEQMEQIAREKGTHVVVGYDLHFDPGLNKIRELMQKPEFSRPLSFQSEVGQYLPDWRPSEDYREGMSAKKAMGGGVMLDLIHEFDYIQWMFGSVISVYGIHKQSSSLEIETEDVSITLLETHSGVVGSIYLDYLQKELARSCKIVFDKGTILWNYAKSEVQWMTHKEPEWSTYTYMEFERNDRFLAIMRAFMESTLHEDPRLTDLSQGIHSMKIVEAAKKSNKERKCIEI